MCGSTFISSQIELLSVEMVTVFEKTVITNSYAMASTQLTAQTWLCPRGKSDVGNRARYRDECTGIAI